MVTFTARELRERTSEVIRHAESGGLSVVTRHGKPVFVALPFDELLVREGFGLALSLRLFEQGEISLGKAARLAGMKRQEFMEELQRRKIAISQIGETELDEELQRFG